MSDTIDLNDVTVDSELQARSGMDFDTLDEYINAIKANNGVWPFPAIDIVTDDDGNNWLTDGFHRVKAALICGLTAVPANITQGSRRDAVLHSAGTNTTHGLKRTNADKENAVKMILNDPEWWQWSDRKIAEICRVSHPFVGKVRSSFTGNVSSERTYTNKHGQTATMQTGNIGGNAQPKEYALTWHLQMKIGDWLRGRGAGIDLINELKEKKDNHDLWSDMLTTLPTPNRKRDVIQAVNNVADIWRQREEEKERRQKRERRAAREASQEATRKRPTPPDGLIPFDYKKGCPDCQSQKGSTWNPSQWQDPEAEKLKGIVENLDKEWFKTGRKGPRPEGNAPEFIQLRDHWSRFTTGKCGDCDCFFWHDFGGDGGQWHYYYMPAETAVSGPAGLPEIEKYIRAWLVYRSGNRDTQKHYQLMTAVCDGDANEISSLKYYLEKRVKFDNRTVKKAAADVRKWVIDRLWKEKPDNVAERRAQLERIKMEFEEMIVASDEPMVNSYRHIVRCLSECLQLYDREFSRELNGRVYE